MGKFSAGRRAGFTLIELLVIIIILGILATIALPQYRRAVERTRVAEALTMLRSIYDSCERYAWENNMDSCVTALKQRRIAFQKLDVVAKGTYQGTLALQTKNFLYGLSPLGFVGAEATRGDYEGALISFNGQTFSCDAMGAKPPEGRKACVVWGASTWNE